MTAHKDQKMVLVNNFSCDSGEGGNTLVKPMNGWTFSGVPQKDPFSEHCSEAPEQWEWKLLQPTMFTWIFFEV